MKAAIVSDIHSNLEALTAVHRDIKGQGVDLILNLGDTIGYGRDAVECLEWAEQNCEINLRGNHEKAVLDVWDAPGVSLGGLYGHVGEGAAEGVYWTFKNFFGDQTPLEQKLEDAKRYAVELIGKAKSSKSRNAIAGRERIERLRAWPVEQTIPLHEQGIRFGITHDNPIEPGKHRYILDPENPLYNKTRNRYSPEEVFGQWEARFPDTSLWFYGHSHFPGVYQVNSGSALKSSKPRRVLVGVGSVGIPRDGRDATYALLTVDKEKWSVRIRRVSGIDWERIGRQWIKVNLKDKFAKMELD